MKVIEFGYAGRGSKERLQELMKDKNVVLVDIRATPRCKWEPAFNRNSLAEDYRGQYLWLGDELGNKNYRPEDREKGIQLVKPESGIPRLMLGLEKGFTLVLFCACREYESCHRHTVVDLLQARVPGLEIVHPEHETAISL